MVLSPSKGRFNMAKRNTKAEITCSENSKCNHDELNDLQNDIVNINESNVDKNSTDGYSCLNINIDEGIDEKNFNKENIATLAAEPSGSSSYPRRRGKKVFCPPGPPSSEDGHNKKDVTTVTAEASGSSSRLRRRREPVSYCPPRSPSPGSQPSSSAKKIKIKKLSTPKNKRSRTDHEIDKQSRDSNNTNHSLSDSSNDEDEESNIEQSASCASIALEKLKFDIELDPNVVDRYTDSGFDREGAVPESPETRRQRIDIISRQCRLHPANKKYNQGPIENPPLIEPEKKVGYTPAGQRHEVELNFDRPKRFNSEYEMLQWDYATIVNVSRMFGDMEAGQFLPDGLDPNVERRYIAEEEMATNMATQQFQEIARASSSRGHIQSLAPDLTEEEKEHLRLLDVENELIELNKYSVVRLQDFAGEIDRKLRKCLDLTITPLMIKKNPMILDTLEALATQCFHIEVVLAAQALIDKIKGLFEVPEDQEFREFFAAEVEKLKENTKNMTGIEILKITEEPPDESDDSASLVTTIPLSRSDSWEDLSTSESEAEDWFEIENGDVWIDVHQDENNFIGFSYENSTISTLSSNWEFDQIYYSESEDSSSDLSISDDELEAQLEDLAGTFISGMQINGRYTLTITVNYFEYI